ncbi:type VI secretion system accessory protein TagJ [Aureliella helgolandensis]|uniref:ImpE protein n=1 Tax=Aureliella helgolandensis TaxID=2527968 RepID=A0A518GAG0_9BACT|nr:type VI secretion system accessory protein TagJ [Aureliella helgolandensis]QDV25570.1 ImpE protein [Aureliella helgolandensis]
MNASELFQAGDLQGALTAATAELKAKPTDVSGRLLLAELLWFSGQLDRVEKQLETVSLQSTQGAMTLALYRQILRGELAREQVLREGRPPEIVSELPEHARLTLESLMAARLGQSEQLRDLLQKASQAQPEVRGVCNGEEFVGIRDLDDRVAGVLEVITGTGKYYWVPWENIESLEMEAPKVPLDLLYRRTQIEVSGGPNGEVYVPTRYVAAADEQLEDALLLGRATDWIGEEGELVQGRGLRTLLLGDKDLPVMEIQTLSFASSEA